MANVLFQKPHVCENDDKNSKFEGKIWNIYKIPSEVVIFFFEKIVIRECYDFHPKIPYFFFFVLFALLDPYFKTIDP